MNIFYLSRNPLMAAQGLGDAHVLKQILETAQLLDTAHSISLVPRPVSVFNNPCATWARYSRETYVWLFQHFEELLNEYSFRFGKVHAYQKYIMHLANADGCTFQAKGWIEPPKVMPRPFASLLGVEHAYRAYYRHGKKAMHKWTKREPPTWLYNIHNA